MRDVFCRGDKLNTKISENLALGQVKKEFDFKLRSCMSKTLGMKIENF